MKTTKSTSMVATCRGRTGISEATQRELMCHMRRCVRSKGEGHGGKSVDGGYCLSLEQRIPILPFGGVAYTPG